jgi:exonuclease III
MRFGTWNVRSLYMAGSLTAAARELVRYKLDLVGVQEVRWDNGAWSDQEIIFLLWNKSH